MDTSDSLQPTIPSTAEIPSSAATPRDLPLPAAPAADDPPILEPSNMQVAAPFRFHGDAREYFRIWIVNTLLTLLTFGLFSAWAKVRKRRYLRGNTELLGHRFDY